MINIEDKVKAIVIPSGNPQWNRKRMETAIEVNEKMGLNVPYIISGIGPDMNDVLFGDSNGKVHDFHQDLYDYMMQNTEGVIGMDILSTSSVGNILNTFPPSVSGRYMIVSYPLHLKRFKRIVEKAKKEDKPIFLSIGYSTCHWCHVMEHESFEDDEVSQLMNETFVSIKVDR